MVDAVVSFAIERVGEYLIRQAVFLQGVKDEVVTLKKDLEWMHSFIKDAEHKQLKDHLIRRWVSDIRDIAYDSEDVLDKFMLKIHDKETSNMLKVDEGGISKRPRSLFSLLKKCSCICDQESGFCNKGKEMVNLYGIGKEIETIKERLSGVKDRCELYRLENINNISEGESQSLGKLRQLRKTTSFERAEITVVGYEDVTCNLLGKLLDNESSRFVISIYGTGGLGKTTLARKLYHNKDVTNKFGSYRSWVSVSQDYRTQDLLVRIIKSFNNNVTKELEKMSIDDLERYLNQWLQGNSYLVVIDDVWDREAWKSIKRAFPDNKNGSRVIITTRNKDIAENSDENSYAHALRFLTANESWKLFREKAFENSIANDGLEKLGQEMVPRCGGLPLAIVVLGGLLKRKSLKEWQKVHKQIWQDLSKDIEISYLLALSFNDLPLHLKACFLYLGHFPEDHVIATQKLIRLWVAEGFIEQHEKLMEDVANDYLNELINRSLIQIDSMKGGRIEKCRVHDLLRDLAIQNAKLLNFVDIYAEEKSTHSVATCRRQAVYSLREMYLWLQQCNPLFRSLLFFENDYAYNENITTMAKDLPTVLTRCRLLRVLDLQNCYLGDSNVLEIGKLIHLKYLGLRDTCIHDLLPPTILNLLSLQTLDIYQSDQQFFPQPPSGIYKLKELRHLIGEFWGGHSEVENLTELQTLKYLCNDLWNKINPEKLVNLRELGISTYMADQKEFSFDSIAKLKSLQILSLELVNHDYFFSSLQPLSHCQNLLDLSLNGKIENLPGNLHELLPNLECLSLFDSDLEDDPIPTLEKLQSLMFLHLGEDSYNGNKMIFSAKGFPNLETLSLGLEDVEEWEVEEGAMPMLRALKIECEMEIPERLRSIPLQRGWER